MIRVVIADDQAVVRGGLRMILESDEGIEVAGEAGDGRQALDLVRRLDPDVVLMDIRMPVVDGIEATRRLTTAGGAARVLVLTTYDLDENVYDALKAGAAGFLVKTDSPARLLDAVRVVAAGEALLTPEITRRLVHRFVAGLRPNSPAPPALDELTARELEVLKLIARGLSNAEIAQALVVSDGTVKTHVARILSKLSLRDRVQIVVFAYECGFVEAGVHSTEAGVHPSPWHHLGKRQS
jgi:DNA-binding NarL/FixJ family response regulator